MTPTIPTVSVRYLPADRLNPAHWQVQHCPFCRKKHTHGAGVPLRDSLGSRHSHCVPFELYELVPDRSHAPTMAALEADDGVPLLRVPTF